MSLLALITTAWILAAVQDRTVTGIVRDPTSAAVAGASVSTAPAAAAGPTTTDADGRFTIAVPAGDFMLVVTAPAFQPVRRVVRATESARIEVTLVPAVASSVTVTAGRSQQPLSQVAATVSIVDQSELDRSPAMTTDDVLRQVPAFSLFRRSSSVAAHPTAQGVSLRGIGPSGVSRTLVLLDGIPFNDPFGGWISWTRVPRASIDRIEIVEGSGANLFGNYSMGGAINLVTRAASRPWMDATLQYGERTTPRLDVALAAARGKVSGLIDAGGFSTDGYTVLPDTEQGLVDERVTAESRRVYGAVRYQFGNGTTIQGRGDLFDESRNNGKRSTIDGVPEQNSTKWSAFGIDAHRAIGTTELRGSVFGDRVRFRSNFLAVPAATPPRSIGRMTLDQFVPSSSLGASAQWTRTVREWTVLTAGVDWRAVEGESREDVLDPLTGTRVVAHRVSGGTQEVIGAFAQASGRPLDSLLLTAALRHDRWNNADGHNLESNEDGQPTANDRPSLPDRSDAVTTPRLSAHFAATSSITLWSAVGWGFRAPTLNELYRQFRVGAVTTLANEALGPERLRTIEGGVRLRVRETTSIRGAVFDNALRDAVSNVTVATSGTAVTQQRQNLGLTRIRGAQVDVDWRPSPGIGLSAAYILNDATVREFAANPALVGKQLAQVPRHRATAQLHLSHRLAEVSLALQVVGRQFDDDLNVRSVPGHTEPGLPGAATVDLLVSRRLGNGLSAFAGAQNLFDRRAFAGTLPTTLAAPRMVSVGLRWRPRSRP